MCTMSAEGPVAPRHRGGSPSRPSFGPLPWSPMRLLLAAVTASATHWRCDRRVRHTVWKAEQSACLVELLA